MARRNSSAYGSSSSSRARRREFFAVSGARLGALMPLLFGRRRARSGRPLGLPPARFTLAEEAEVERELLEHVRRSALQDSEKGARAGEAQEGGGGSAREQGDRRAGDPERELLSSHDARGSRESRARHPREHEESERRHEQIDAERDEVSVEPHEPLHDQRGSRAEDEREVSVFPAPPLSQGGAALLGERAPHL